MMDRVVRVLELRSVRGTGGGPEKTILLGAARSAHSHLAITICYLRDRRDQIFEIDRRATPLGVDYTEILERHSFDVRVIPALRRLVRERQIDIVHAHDYKTDLAALILARTDGVIALATAHGWTGHTPRERYVYYPADKWLLARFPRVIAVSGEIRNELVRFGASPSAVTVVLNGIDPQRFRRDRGRVENIRAALGLASDDYVIGAVGRLTPQKRFDILIDTFAALRTTRPDLRLLIAGGGPLHQTLQTQIDRLGLSGVARLLGHTDDVATFHHALDLFVQSSDYEGTSNAILEAMALETPIVATDAGGTREQIVHGVHGVIVPPGRPEALRAGIALVLDDHAAASQRAAAARARVEDALSFDARMNRLDDIYLELALSRNLRRRPDGRPSRSCALD